MRGPPLKKRSIDITAIIIKQPSHAFILPNGADNYIKTEGRRDTIDIKLLVDGMFRISGTEPEPLRFSKDKIE